MKEIIKQWQQFIDEWSKNQPTVEFGGKKGKWKPDFYDFMEWLSKNSSN